MAELDLDRAKNCIAERQLPRDKKLS